MTIPRVRYTLTGVIRTNGAVRLAAKGSIAECDRYLTEISLLIHIRERKVCSFEKEWIANQCNTGLEGR